MSKIFTIVTNGRSGSTFLIRYLKACDGVTMLPEVFHNSFMKSYPYKGDVDFLKFQQKCFNNPSKYLNDISKQYKTPFVGSKTVIGEIGWDNVHNLLDNPDNIKVVFLYRKNILHRYLSAFYGDQIKKWHITNVNQRKNIVPKDVDIKWLCSKVDFERPRLAKIISTCQQNNYYIIEYEDLFQDFTNQINQLCNYLHIKPPQKTPDNLTVKSVRNYSFVKNKDEVNKLFSQEFGEII